jgi:hypothetical protein
MLCKVHLRTKKHMCVRMMRIHRLYRTPARTVKIKRQEQDLRYVRDLTQICSLLIYKWEGMKGLGSSFKS